MTVAVDLNVRHFAIRRGIITGVGTWLHQDRRTRPCMALIRTGDEYSENLVPCIVTADNAWIWSEDIGDPRRAAHMAMTFAEALRIGDTPRDAFKIARFVHDHLGDLLTIPPFPPAAAPATPIAEVTITHRETGKVTEVVLTDV